MYDFGDKIHSRHTHCFSLSFTLQDGPSWSKCPTSKNSLHSPVGKVRGEETNYCLHVTVPIHQ